VISFLSWGGSGWQGLFFPYPEFGGVLVIRQQKESSVATWLHRVFLGEGEWIPQERIKEFPYLRGQNNLPYQASTYIGESFKFRKGILAPTGLMGHDGEVRIPNAEGRGETRAIATYFEATPETPGMIYHYFGLEPYGKDRTGLAVELLIPGDGTPVVYAIDNEKNGRALKGVSNVPEFIRNSVTTEKVQVDWNTSAPVEHRPWVKMIDGKVRRFWMSTIVTYKPTEPSENGKAGVPSGNLPVVGNVPTKKRSLAGAIPAVTLTDMVSGEVRWVNPSVQEDWIKVWSKK
jgi:hypothetical protein